MAAFGAKGTFFVGCNYLASHAGARMWSDWRAEVVRQDLRRLSDAGLRVLRVFPLWPDFQPISLLRSFEGKAVEYRIGEEPLADDEIGRAGLSSTALDHFQELADLAESFGQKLIVGLITGWMSGRLFVPPALQGLNLHTDPTALMWEVRFVTSFVSRFKGSRAIMAWDLGNECDCMARVPSAEAAWAWTSAISRAIKSVDSERPVISGMHGMTTDGLWTIQHQGELTDFLTTHPYPLFTPHCDQDPLNSIRNELHAVAETLFNRGIGGKPCFVEETGTLGPMFAGEETEAEFARVVLFSTWAHDCRGFLWWCAFDFPGLPEAPYDWKAFEGELGVFRGDGSTRPIVHEMQRFQDFLASFPHQVLPGRIVDGICILTSGQDAWGAAFSAFILAKQSGLDLEFQFSSQPIRDADLYIMPCVRGAESMSRRRMQELLARVSAGALLYISLEGGLLGSFSELSGMRVVSREKYRGPEVITLSCAEGSATLELGGGYRLNMAPVTADVLASAPGGRPVFTCAPYGKGKILVLDSPLETHCAETPGVFHGKTAQPFFSIYQALRDRAETRKMVRTSTRNVGLTEHIVDGNERIIVVINYQPEDTMAALRIDQRWKTAGSLFGDAGPPVGVSGTLTLQIGRNNACVFAIRSA